MNLIFVPSFGDFLLLSQLFVFDKLQLYSHFSGQEIPTTKSIHKSTIIGKTTNNVVENIIITNMSSCRKNPTFFTYFYFLNCNNIDRLF